MKAEKLTKETFAPYGKLLSKKKECYDADNEEFAFSANITYFDIAGEGTVGLLEGKKREITLKCMERHIKTPEILFQIKSDSILFVGKSESDSAEIKEIKPFLLKQGDTVLMDPGIWHWVPFPVDTDRCVTQVIFKKATSETDCEVVELRKAVHLVK